MFLYGINTMGGKSTFIICGYFFNALKDQDEGSRGADLSGKKLKILSLFMALCDRNIGVV